MNLFLGIDLETTGLDVNQAQIIEIGAVVYDFDAKAPVLVFDKLISGVSVSPEITEITGITPEYLELFGEHLGDCLKELAKISSSCRGIISHNGLQFDRPILERHALDFGVSPCNNLSWIDTMIDLPYAGATSYKLTHIAADHGIVNPVAHRAVFDVMTMLQLVTKYDIEKALKMASSPVVRVVAEVGYQNRGLAAEKRFRWEPTERVWVKLMRKAEYELESGKWLFASRIINGG